LTPSPLRMPPASFAIVVIFVPTNLRFAVETAATGEAAAWKIEDGDTGAGGHARAMVDQIAVAFKNGIDCGRRRAVGQESEPRSLWNSNTAFRENCSISRRIHGGSTRSDQYPIGQR
jgi:hypothetical protein